VHKAWLHELKEGERWEDTPPTRDNPLVGVKDREGKALMHMNLSTVHSFFRLKEYSKNKEDLIKKIFRAGVDGDVAVTVEKKGRVPSNSGIPNSTGSLLTVHLSKSHEKQVKEAKSPLQRLRDFDEAMGSMRPETGSKNIIITKLAIDMSQQGMSMPEVHKQMKLLRKKKLPELKKLAKELQMRQSKKEEVELDENLEDVFPWLKKLKDKLFDKTHSTQLDKLSYEYAKRAAKELRDKKKLNHIAIIHDIAKVYNNLGDRVLKNHINDLVKKGMIPKDLRAEYEPMEEVLSKNASQEDYIDDFVSSGAPQFKGKSKKERIDMAIAAYNSKNEETEIISVIIEKSEESNIPYSILKEVYNRGINTYKENHRPGTTPKEWGIARVNSFITRKRGTWNSTDRDLAEQVKLLENNIQLNINNKG
jgi:hypothetical protein